MSIPTISIDIIDVIMIMDRDHFPEPTFSREELTFLQELLNQERADIFNYYEELMFVNLTREKLEDLYKD